jgi:4-amino-4-deoxy-L-arabinose transferase-like glycosyltransferase
MLVSLTFMKTESPLPMQTGPTVSPARKATVWLQRGLLLLTLLLCSLRFFYLNADFPNNSPWSVDQAKFTDEGWWANAAVMHYLVGHWHIPGDYNPAVAVPIWPLLLAAIFHFTGVNILAARATSVAISIAILGIVFMLVRRHSQSGSDLPAILSVLLLAASPFAFVFSRLAILDSLVVFQFCLLLLIASYISKSTWISFVALASLIPVLILTKTTALALLPAVFWMAGTAMKSRLTSYIGGTVLACAFVAVTLKIYIAFVFSQGFGPDYRNFFSVNLSESIRWGRSPEIIAGIFRDGTWIDPILYPLALLIMIGATLRARRLWSNPLFTASWIAIAYQAIFIFTRQSDYPPRYFLVMLAPIAIAVALAVDEMRQRHRMAYLLTTLAIAISLIVNMATIFSFLKNRTYMFYNAATSIANIVRADPGHNHLILGVSGSQLSLMTGLPSINDAYGTQDLGQKLLTYRPGWYLVWHEIPPDEPALSSFQFEKVATYTVFDDDDRNPLVLYRMEQRPQ